MRPRRHRKLSPKCGNGRARSVRQRDNDAAATAAPAGAAIRAIERLRLTFCRLAKVSMSLNQAWRGVAWRGDVRRRPCRAPRACTWAPAMRRRRTGNCTFLGARAPRLFGAAERSRAQRWRFCARTDAILFVLAGNGIGPVQVHASYFSRVFFLYNEEDKNNKQFCDRKRIQR